MLEEEQRQEGFEEVCWWRARSACVQKTGARGERERGGEEEKIKGKKIPKDRRRRGMITVGWEDDRLTSLVWTCVPTRDIERGRLLFCYCPLSQPSRFVLSVNEWGRKREGTTNSRTHGMISGIRSSPRHASWEATMVRIESSVWKQSISRRQKKQKKSPSAPSRGKKKKKSKRSGKGAVGARSTITTANNTIPMKSPCATDRGWSRRV